MGIDQIDRVGFLNEFANWRSLRRLYLTFDVDWAPDYMIQHVVDILAPYDVGVTFFATHDSPLLRKIATEGRHEVGWHPNLGANSSQGSGTDAVLKTLGGWYPKAVGCRFHVLGFSYRDLMKLAGVGIQYDVSRLLYNTSHLQPSYHRDLELNLFPYVWEDGICENAGDRVSVDSVCLDTPGLKILNFHPMNIFINAPTAVGRLKFMGSFKSLLDCPETLARQHRLEGETGSQRALEGVLARVRSDKLVAAPLRELSEAYSVIRN